MNAKEYIRSQRSTFLAALAYGMPSPLLAVIGVMDGEDVKALAKGLTRTLRFFKEPRDGTVAWYQYKDKLCQTPSHRRPGGRPCLVQRAMTIVGERYAPMVRQVVAKRVDVDMWKEDVAERLRSSPRRWGMVVHSPYYGRGDADGYLRARREFDVMTPLLDERTLVLLMGIKTVRGQHLLSQLWHRGWKGNVMERMNMAVLSLPPFVKERDQCPQPH
jgi:hypothetical protein